MPSWRNLKGGLLTLALVLEAAHDAQHLCASAQASGRNSRTDASESERTSQCVLAPARDHILQDCRAHLRVKANRRCAHSRNPTCRHHHASRIPHRKIDDTTPTRGTHTRAHCDARSSTRMLARAASRSRELLRLRECPRCCTTLPGRRGVYILLDGGEWLLLMLWQTRDRLFHPFLLLCRRRSRLGLGGSVLQLVVRHSSCRPSPLGTLQDLLPQDLEEFKREEARDMGVD